MLNDIAWPTRIAMAAMGVAMSLMAGGPLLDSDLDSSVFAVLAGSGALLLILVLVSTVVLPSLADRSFRSALSDGIEEIAVGEVAPVAVPARVVRRSLDRHRSSFMPGSGHAPGPSVVLVLAVLPPDSAPRRVAALVPAQLGLRLRRAPAVVLLHPERPEVAVVDDRVSAEQLAAVSADLRWGTERLPTDRRVVGGYLALVASVIVGAAIGLALVAAILKLT